MGALQAAQAGNQLLALQAQQLADLTATIAAQGRAQNLEAPSAWPPRIRRGSSFGGSLRRAKAISRPPSRCSTIETTMREQHDPVRLIVQLSAIAALLATVALSVGSLRDIPVASQRSLIAGEQAIVDGQSWHAAKRQHPSNGHRARHVDLSGRTTAAASLGWARKQARLRSPLR